MGGEDGDVCYTLSFLPGSLEDELKLMYSSSSTRAGVGPTNLKSKR